MISRRRALVLENTRLQRVPLVPELELHLAGEITPIWRMTQDELGETCVPPPYWAFVWPGGQAVARYLLDHSEEVAGKRVLDLATGSGLCAIAAMKAGAAHALTNDVDPFCEEAVSLNARANGVSLAFSDRDLLDGDPPGTDVILAGDVWYEKLLAERALTWLRAAHARGIRTLMGDPGRPYFPGTGLIELAVYQVPTTREIEDSEVKPARVFTFPARWDLGGE